MREHEMNASGPAENRTQKEPQVLSADKQRNSPLPGGWQYPPFSGSNYFFDPLRELYPGLPAPLPRPHITDEGVYPDLPPGSIHNINNSL
jgi:hypothetical protein